MRLLVIGLTVCFAVTSYAKPRRVLRVCADPNNLPFSSEHARGFENEIAELIARELHARIEYTWWAQRRGFFRNTLNARACDLVIGVPVGIELARTTRPYYRSAFAFVTRADRKLDLRSLDDKRLRSLRIGVQLVGDDGRNPPPAHALAARGIVNNVAGFTAYGDYRKTSPGADVLRAVEAGLIDVAIVWGPLAGGFARRSTVRLVVTPIAEASDRGQPLQFEIALAVRRNDTAFAHELDRVLVKRRADITRILDRWRVPRIVARESPP